MLGPIIGIVLLVGAILLVLYAYASLFPNYSKLWLAVFLAAVVLGVIRALHNWFCALVCG